MRANQYRLGNLVKYNGKIYEIDSISKEFPTLNTIEYGVGVVDWNNIEPIPLTEEWLVRFGFDKKDDLILKLNGFTICFEKVNQSILLCYLECVGIDIRYAHQLQNLFYALSNQELTIKP